MFGKIQSTLILIGSAIAGIFMVFFYGKTQGKNDAQQEQKDNLLAKNKKASDLDNNLRMDKSLTYKLLHKNSSK